MWWNSSSSTESKVLIKCAIICVQRKRTILSFAWRSGSSVAIIVYVKRLLGVSGTPCVCSGSSSAKMALSDQLLVTSLDPDFS